MHCHPDQLGKLASPTMIEPMQHYLPEEETQGSVLRNIKDSKLGCLSKLVKVTENNKKH